jgi:hypothetical protein
MDASKARLCVIAGLVLMVGGALDPMEGSVVVLAGSALAAGGGHFGRMARRDMACTAFGLIAIGVAALFGFSAIGGIGGNSGRSIWWGLTMLPYPVGWVMGIAASVSSLRAERPSTV